MFLFTGHRTLFKQTDAQAKQAELRAQREEPKGESPQAFGLKNCRLLAAASDGIGLTNSPGKAKQSVN